MSGCFLGIDTSNYTTSLAAVEEGRVLFHLRRLLPVQAGECGLRQSEALFTHTKHLPLLFEEARPFLADKKIYAVGVSEKPRNETGSYMPCFLAGVSVAEGISAALSVPLYRFSHQCGHLRAALYSSEAEFLHQPFGAFHISGGTTELLLVTPDERGFRTQIVGGTCDLNAGQLIDRIGVSLGLSFPAGPALEELASKYEGAPPKKPVRTEDGFVHLSGVENQARALMEDDADPSKVAAFVLDHLARVLIAMSLDFRKKYSLPLLYAGGVMSNAYIRKEIEKKIPQAFFAAPQFSSDNAVGTAFLASEAERSV